MIIRDLKFWMGAYGIIMACLLGWFAFMIADNEPPYVYDASESYVKPSPAHEGQQITVYWKVTRVNRYCPGVGHRVIFDPKTKVILADYDPIPTAEPSAIKEGYLPRTFSLPANFSAPEVAGYRQTGCYKCNFYQRFVPLCVTTPDLFFRFDGQAP